VQVEEHQSAEQVRLAYDAMADDYASTYRSTEPEQSIELAMVDYFAASLRGDRRVLDVGCGTGRFLPILANLMCDVEGIDLSPNMVRQAQKIHPSFATKVANLTDLPFEDSSFDGYFAWYSTIHCHDGDLNATIREAHRILRPGASILMAFQSGSGVQDLSGSSRARGYAISLVRYLRSPERIAEILTSVGFSIHAVLERGPVGDRELENQAVVIAAR